MYLLMPKLPEVLSQHITTTDYSIPIYVQKKKKKLLRDLVFFFGKTLAKH